MQGDSDRQNADHANKQVQKQVKRQADKRGHKAGKEKATAADKTAITQAIIQGARLHTAIGLGFDTQTIHHGLSF